MVLNDGAGDAETSRVDFRRFFLWTIRLWLGNIALFGCKFVVGPGGGEAREIENGVLGVGGFAGTRNSVSMSSSEV